MTTTRYPPPIFRNDYERECLARAIIADGIASGAFPAPRVDAGDAAASQARADAHASMAKRNADAWKTPAPRREPAPAGEQREDARAAMMQRNADAYRTP